MLLMTVGPHLRLVAQSEAGPASPAADGPAAAVRQAPRRSRRRPLAQILLERQAVEPGDMIKAIALKAREDARLSDILLARGWVSPRALADALAEEWGTRPADLRAVPPDARLVDTIGTSLCLRLGCVPLRRLGGATVLAVSRPEDFDSIRASLPAALGPYVMAVATETEVHAAILNLRQTSLRREAETRPAEEDSCRRPAQPWVVPAIVATAAAAVAWPAWAALVILFAAVLGHVASMTLKFAAFLAAVTAPRRDDLPRPHLITARAPRHRKPVVSLIVPLFREMEIAGRLLDRLRRIDYPTELLDILLVVEEADNQTAAALLGIRLPHHVRIITVPDGPLKTKPRALNFALNFCRGSIVGVYDAEDRPDPRQIHRVVAHFAQCGPDVACVQGVLDFYNRRHNWLSRCFAIEYAAWFRAVLPGMARLGLVVPLGGTTLFFRRTILETIGAWDAHNVTEDADLGIRLARRGYRTEFIDSVTEEEPNVRALSWIRQRSRWLKGYALTWSVHMRQPIRLWREVGALRFLGLQALFFGTLSQFLLAPVLWGFWLVALGLSNPYDDVIPSGMLTGLGVTFVLAELLNLVVAIWAVRRAGHRDLIAWTPTMAVYFPLGTLAAFKALAEVVTRPFYWDKTEHGLCDHEGTCPEGIGRRPGEVPLLPPGDVLVLHQLVAPSPAGVPAASPAPHAGPLAPRAAATPV
jgi:cellulose synthase/poly-beta-1,6-N-acetylglucosamine synthase-like glycosyltransferase